jgi:hypothetical protein
MKKTTVEYHETWFTWVPAAATDITVTFRKHGWVPPSELPAYQQKWREWKLKLAGCEDAVPVPQAVPENVIRSGKWQRVGSAR